MYVLVFIEIALCNKWLPAHITGVWTLPSMHTLMCLQENFNSKRLTADATAKCQLFTICALRFVNIAPVTVQEYGRSPVWICWCRFRLLLSLNTLLHKSRRIWAFPGMCALMSVKITLAMNTLLHTLQEYALCISRSFLLENELLQTWQPNGWSPLCNSWCVFRWLLLVSDFLHTSQRYGCSPGCNNRCVFRWLLLANDFSQMSQWYGCPPLFTVNDFSDCTYCWMT